MQQTFLKFRNAIAFVLVLSLAACGGSAVEEAHDHDNGDHDHTHATEQVAPADNTELGPEYTSAYVCPMHCEGSGGDEAGVCPVCQMDYVARDEHEADGHKH